MNQQARTAAEHLHPLGETRTGTVRHACPECVLGQPRPFCRVCLGAGLVDVGQLMRYEAQCFDQAEGR